MGFKFGIYAGLVVTIATAIYLAAGYAVVHTFGWGGLGLMLSASFLAGACAHQLQELVCSPGA